MPKANIFDSREALDAALSGAICRQLTAGIDQNGSAILVVSGGSTPKGLFKALSATAIDWPKVTVLLADERWVDDAHPDSNSAMVKSLLLNDHAKEANWLDLGAGKDNVEAELARVKRGTAERVLQVSRMSTLSPVCKSCPMMPSIRHVWPLTHVRC